MIWSKLFSRVLRDSTLRFVGPSVGPSIHRSVGPLVRHTLLFRRLWGFWLYRSCPNAPLTSNMAPAHPHATSAAVYPALFFLFNGDMTTKKNTMKNVLFTRKTVRSEKRDGQTLEREKLCALRRDKQDETSAWLVYMGCWNECVSESLICVLYACSHEGLDEHECACDLDA